MVCLNAFHKDKKNIKKGMYELIFFISCTYYYVYITPNIKSYLSVECDAILKRLIRVQRYPCVVLVVRDQIVLFSGRHLSAPLKQLHGYSLPRSRFQDNADITRFLTPPKHRNTFSSPLPITRTGVCGRPGNKN